MGKTILRKLVSITLALALVLTSGIGVFAASSPTTGKVPTTKPAKVSTAASKVKAGKVLGVSSVATANSMTVKWTSAKNAKFYNVYLNGKLVKKHVRGKSVVIKGLKSGGMYNVRVAGVTKYGKVGAKSGVTAYKNADGSAALTKRWLKKATIKSVTAGKKKATIKWKAVKGAAKYQILQYKGGKWQVVKTVGKTTKATVKGLKKGKKYQFKVRAINKKGYVGIWSHYKTTKKIK